MPHFKDVRIECLPELGKKQPKTDYFQEFHLSQSLIHKIDNNHYQKICTKTIQNIYKNNKKH